jgi:hypothetical protein
MDSKVILKNINFKKNQIQNIKNEKIDLLNFPNILIKNENKIDNLYSFSIIEIARQITLIEFDFYKKIFYYEFLKWYLLLLL